MEGESVRSVHTWLEQKYSKSSRHNRVSIPTLQAFRKETLKLEGKVLGDIIEAKKLRDAEEEAIVAEQIVKGTSAYRETIEKIADKSLDVATRLIQLDAVVGDRIEHYYNLLKSGEAVPEKAEYDLRKYIDQMMALNRDWKKMIEGMADKRIDYNVNVTVMNEQVHELQSAVMDLIREELDPEKAIDFMEKLSNRLGGGPEIKALPGKVVDVTNDP
jgi:hypothetical protein